MNRLTDSDLNYVPDPPVFGQMAAQPIQDLDGELGNYDLDLLDMASSIASEPDDGSSFDGLLSLMAFNPGDFQAQNYDPINAAHAAFLGSYEAQLVDNENGLSGDPTPGGGSPNPPTAPTPPGTGPPPAQTPGPGDFPGITCRSIQALNPRVLNSTPDSGIYVSADQRATTARIIFGDPSVWYLVQQDQPVSGGGPYGSGPIHNVILHARLTKAGHFAVTVQLSVAGYLVNQNFCYTIDIG